MAAGREFLLLILSAAAVAGLASAAAPFLSDTVFQGSAGSTGRSLLQTKKSCPVNFEFQNYTIITSKCKGPKFPADKCCSAFLEFACPFSDYINDDDSECASTMFSYINLYGKYPPGLFASECKGDKKGLSCANVTEKVSVNSAAYGAHLAQSSSLGFFAIICGVVALFFH